MWMKPKAIAVALLAILAVSPLTLERRAGAEEAERDDILAGPNDQPREKNPSSRRFDGRKRRGHIGDRVHQIMDDLNLNDQQKEQARQIMREQMQARKQWRQQHAKELDEIEQQMRELREKRHKLMADMPERHKMIEKIRPLLDEDQRKILDEKVKQFRERAEKHGRSHHDRPRKRREGGQPDPSQRPAETLDL